MVIVSDVSAEVWDAVQQRMRRASEKPAPEVPQMTTLNLDLSSLSPADQEELARALERTYHLRWGQIERADERFFRLPYGSLPSPEADAGMLRQLIAGIRSPGETGKARGELSRKECYRFSDALQQTRNREGISVAVRDTLDVMIRDFDKSAKVTGDETVRAATIHQVKPSDLVPAARPDAPFRSL